MKKNHFKEEAKALVNSQFDALFKSNLIMVHETVGEVSPDVTATLAEKRRLATELSYNILDRELVQCHPIWNRRKINRLMLVADEIKNV